MTGRVVAFDMDGVLVEGQSSWVSVHSALGTDNEAGYEAFTTGRIDDHEFMRSDIALWLDRGVDHVDQVEEVLDRVELHEGAERTIGELRRRGFLTVIVSGGLDILANRIGAEVGIDAILANGLETFEDGRLTGRGVLRVPLLNKRAPLAVAISRMAGMDAWLASVGDSAVDIAMFLVSDLSIAFNPRDRVVSEGATRTVFSADLSDILEYLRPESLAPSRRERLEAEADVLRVQEVYRRHRASKADRSGGHGLPGP
ncbi:MAG: HAD-IB family phosphatase [Thermoplasmata archaeon]|nr:HAD-IB family phosphatase [Thermoplasmata archaeon]